MPRMPTSRRPTGIRAALTVCEPDAVRLPQPGPAGVLKSNVLLRRYAVVFSSTQIQ